MTRTFRLWPGAHAALATGLAVLLLFPNHARAGPFQTYVTGDAPGGDVIFRVTFDPGVAGSAVVTPILTDGIRLDGIDFVASSTTKVVVGAQGMGTGAIRQYDVSSGSILAPFVANTNLVTPSAPASGASRPSTVLSTASHVYYTENQFGFAGGTHRIMQTPIAGPAGTAAVVFDGSLIGRLGLRNMEGLEIVGSRLYFFAENHLAPTERALYSIGLDGSGVWNGVTPTRHLAGLTEGPGGDGSDELDYDPLTGMLYGSNNISGEVIFYDPVATTGGFLISPAALIAAPPGSSLARMRTAMLDGIRTTGDGYLVLSGIDGVLLSIDLAGVAAGLDASDVKILYDDRIAGNGYKFDDLTPLAAFPEPGSLTLAAFGVAGLVGYLRRRRKRAR